MAEGKRDPGRAGPTNDPETERDMEDLNKGLWKFCGVPEEEKSEKAALRSRIEEQYHLICILKRRADDAHKRCKGLEQLSKKLEELRTEDAAKLKAQTQRIQCLEERFMDLAGNHEKMIRFKDEHKKQNMQLREENKRLTQENETLFSQTVREKEAEVLQLTSQARELSQQLDSLREKCAYEIHRAQEREKEMLEAQTQQASAYAREVDSLKKQLQCLQEKHQQAVAQVNQEESQHRAQGSELEVKLERVYQEKEELLKLAVERGKALQEKQQEIQQLGKKLESAEKARQLAEERCVKEAAAAAGGDLRVQELRQQLESSKQAYSELWLQFDAYKKHSQDLLTKERELNVKLRHFIA
ncbi:coiled-coil domain-containing protein 89 [Apteryx mantelli]|uniref:Coiled-coil domain-containing protein 89 n=1 Tax=Apteryx mantelli TaxID=2696672 RepID=A0A8B7II14_9AVES